MVENSQLPLQSEKILPHAIRPHLLAYCSRTDLFAVVTQDEVIEVYRLGGQRAFIVKRKSPQLTIVGLQWIRNGKCLAVALSNGHVDVISGESGKIIRHGGDDPFSTDAGSSKTDRGAITCLGWGTVLTKDTAKSNGTKSQEIDNLSTEEWFDRLQEKRGNALLADDVELRGQKASLNDLPRQLAFIDVESVLPRLTPIPTRHTASGRYDMFATQTALDDYFDSMRRKDRLAADVMFVGHSGGRNRVIVDDILEIKYIPDFPGPAAAEAMFDKDDEAEDISHSLVPLLYASHPHSKQHALLRAEPGDETPEKAGKSYKNLHLSLFDIPLMASGGSHLHLIVSRTAQLRDLCGYVSYSIICAKSDWTTHTNLPSRFMENVNETLEEKNEGVLAQNLYHLAMTGDFTPTILEWLRDELAERGHKRWDHAMSTLYAELSKILLTNLLPVLERSAVVATNLRGLARYYTDSPNFNVSPDMFTAILDTLSCLQLLVQEAVQILGQEQRQFRAFSKWLRHQIDLAAADPESLSAKDMAEREAAHLDLSNVLAYLEGALTNSRLRPIVHSTPETETPQPTMQELITDIHAARNGKEATANLSLHQWSAHLSNACKTAHQHISTWQHAARPQTEDFPCNTSATTSIASALDVRMVQITPGIFKTYVLGVPSTATHSEENICEFGLWHAWMGPQGPDGEMGSGWQQYILPSASSSSQIHALHFLDDATFLALFQHSDTHHLLCLPYFNPQHPTSDPKSQWRSMQDLEPFIAHTFEKGFVPAHLRGNGRVGRRNVVVVEKDCRRWKILDLEGFRVNGGGEEGIVQQQTAEEMAEMEEEEEEEEEDGSMVVD